MGLAGFFEADLGFRLGLLLNELTKLCVDSLDGIYGFRYG